MGDAGGAMDTLSRLFIILSNSTFKTVLIKPSESTALTTGEEGRQFQTKAFEEIVRVLEEQSPEVGTLIERI